MKEDTKKALTIFEVVAMILIAFTAAAVIGGMIIGGSMILNDAPKESELFGVVETSNIGTVVYHKETGVMYMLNKDKAYSFTMLCDSDGKPLLYKGGV